MTILIARQPGADNLAVTIEQAIAQGRVTVVMDRRRGERRRGKALDVGKRASQRRRLKPALYVGIILETP